MSITRLALTSLTEIKRTMNKFMAELRTAIRQVRAYPVESALILVALAVGLPVHSSPTWRAQSGYGTPAVRLITSACNTSVPTPSISTASSHS